MNERVREFLAECLGTMILVVSQLLLKQCKNLFISKFKNIYFSNLKTMGCGAIAVNVLKGSSSEISIGLGFGIGLLIGIAISAPVSGN
jgi:glycerol uptake facilitator-like aquaporin